MVPDRLLRSLSKSRAWYLALAVLLVIILLLFSRKPVIDSSLAGYNIDNNPYDTTATRLSELFGAGNIIQIVIDPGETTAHGFFRGLKEASENLKKTFPGLRVESLASVERQLYNDYDPDSSLKSVLLKAMRVPVIENLVSRDTSLTLLVAFADKVNDFDVQKFDSVTGLPYPGIKKMYTVSRFHIQKEIEDSILRDYAVIMPVILLFFILFIWYSYRSFRGVVFCILNIFLSFVPVVFFLSLFNVTINQVTSSSIPVVIILTLSTSVHYINGFLNRDTQDDYETSVYKVLSYYFIPSFLSVLTTSVAFASFFLSDSHYIRQFGVVTACSLMASFLITNFVAPTTLNLIKSCTVQTNRWNLVKKIEQWIIDRNRILSMVQIAIIIISLFFISHIVFRTDLEKYIPDYSESKTSTQKIREGFHSLAEIDILIEPGTNQLSDSMKTLRGPLIAAVSTLSDKISGYRGVASVQSVKNQLDFEKQKVIFGMQTLRFSKFSNPYVSEDRLKYRINIKVNSQDDIKAVTESFSSDFRQFSNRFRYSTYSDFLYFDYISTSVTRSLLRSLLFSAVIIGVILCLLARRGTAIWASILANTVPLSFLILIFSIFSVEMNISTSITLVVCLGLIVDDTIHILYRKISLSQSMGELGFGVITTSLILTGGFLTFTLSHSQPNRVFGLLCALTFFVASVSDLTIMTWFLKDKSN